MVCMGNICRSPTAQAVLESMLVESSLADSVEVDSAGTHAYHLGSAPDRRAQQAAAARGIDLSRQRARRFVAEDFERYDYIIAMDQENLEVLQAQCPTRELRSRLRLFMDFAPAAGVREVPDPYYGGRLGFERVLDLIDQAARGFFAHLEREHLK